MIISAALKVKDDKFQPLGYIVLPCFRHSNGFEILYDLVGNKYKACIEEGFIDNKNNFLDREGAFNHAIDCGQLSAVTREYKRQNHETKLYSEDLY